MLQSNLYMVRYVIIIYFLLVEMENQHNDLTGPSLQDAPVREGNLLPISPIIPASLSTTINGGVADRAVTSDCRQLGGLNEKPPSHEKGQLSGYHSGQLSSYLAEQLHSRRNERSPSRRSKHSPSLHSRRSPSRRSKLSPSRRSRRSPSRRNERSPSRRNRRSCSRHNGRSPSRRNERSPSRRNRRSCSRHNGRSRSRHNGRSRSHHNGRSRSRHNGRSRSRHNGRSRSPHHGRSRSRHNGRSRSRHNGRSRSRHDRLSCTGYSERSCGRPGGQSGKDRTTRSSGHAEESNEKFGESNWSNFEIAQVLKQLSCKDSLDKLGNVKITNDRKLAGKGSFQKNNEAIQSRPTPRNFRYLNCKQEGHMVAQCKLPLKKCAKCSRIGHESEQCYTKVSTTGKTVLKVSTDNVQSGSNSALSPSAAVSSSSKKYFKQILVNGNAILAFIDFGSECSMIKYSKFLNIGSQLSRTDLPLLKGFGNSTVRALGRCNAHIIIDGIAADFELIIVPDDAMQVPLLIGQNFTEQRHILTKKTSDLLEFSSLESIENSNSKLKLFCKNKISISGLTIVEIYLDDPRFTGELYVEGSVRYIGYKRYSVMSGLYHIEQGHGCIAVSCTPSSKLILHENSLIARGRIAHQENEKVVLNCYSQRPIVESDINVESNIESKYKQQLLDLLNNYRECFAFDLKELNITRVGDMKIDLNDTEPVVEGKILSALKEDITSSLQDDIIKIREEIKSHIETKQAKEKCQFDKKRCEAIKFQVGDLVRVERQIPSTGQSRKLVPKFQGPYRITDVLEHDRYRIEDTPITKKGNRLYSTVVAVDKIEPWLNFKRSHDTDTELSNESE
ncbi:hypothetical protein ACJJTC_007103 [Scirpophaga incertulas]